MSVTVDQIAVGMDLGNCEIRTEYGQWRSAIALYASDEGPLVGTVRAEGNSTGSWRVDPVERFVEIR